MAIKDLHPGQLVMLWAGAAVLALAGLRATTAIQKWQPADLATRIDSCFQRKEPATAPARTPDSTVSDSSLTDWAAWATATPGRSEAWSECREEMERTIVVPRQHAALGLLGVVFLAYLMGVVVTTWRWFGARAGGEPPLKE